VNSRRNLVGLAWFLALAVYVGLLLRHSFEQRAVDIQHAADSDATEPFAQPQILPPKQATDPWDECGLIRERIKVRTADSNAEVIRWGHKILWGRTSALPGGTVSAGFTVRTCGREENWYAFVAPGPHVMGLGRANEAQGDVLPITTARAPRSAR
jgi:hypothetical protein